jgi:hypothetical protein
MYHCSGSPGTDILDALSAIVKSVENGIPPDKIAAPHVENDTVTGLALAFYGTAAVRQCTFA